MRLKITSRKSDLARWQSVQVARHLERLPEKPSVEFIFKSSLGDDNLDVPLANMGAKGVFTEDFHQDLIQGRADLVVHSWKDLPVEDRAGTMIACTLARADMRDLILIPKNVWQETERAGSLKVLTSSPRRVYNLTQCLSRLLPGHPRVEFVNVRGNVPTRLRKMHAEGAALVLAKAGLDRLLEAESQSFLEGGVSVRELIQDCRFQILPLSLNPPAAAQGALAVEIARGNETLEALTRAIADASAYRAVRMEREILSRYGGGCHQKIGVAVVPKPYGWLRALRGLTDAGEVLNEWRIESETEWSKAETQLNVFPLQAKQNSWFERERLPLTQPPREDRGLFVARAEAWPVDFAPLEEQFVWTAGVQTWMKLAEKGVFVSGCHDGLGESEDPGLQTLLGGAVSWCKFTHARAPEGRGRAVATYRLQPKARSPDLNGKTHFYWMSSTAFERARELYPQVIKQGRHACGPGHTYEFLAREKGLNHPIKIFVGLDQFLRETLP
ncbi:MAG TPA: hydroxymethylbilane synthase [Bdellovibrionales bacterium]|nr:hydroxymethylbilane synthase [Bdellovibrionales bacterium]